MWVSGFLPLTHDIYSAQLHLFLSGIFLYDPGGGEGPPQSKPISFPEKCEFSLRPGGVVTELPKFRG